MQLNYRWDALPVGRAASNEGRVRMTKRFEYCDGGRAAAGLEGQAEPKDCVPRAIAIVTRRDYEQVCDIIDGLGSLSRLWQEDGFWLGHTTADEGVHYLITNEVLGVELRWQYHAIDPPERFAMHRLPAGRVVVRFRSIRHVCAVIDHTIYDIEDHTAGGRATISGYWTPPPTQTLDLGE